MRPDTLAAVGIKVCVSCHEPRPTTTGFSRDSSRNDGFCPYCKTCRRGFYQSHRERDCAKMREYNTRNRAVIRAKAKIYRDKRFFRIRGNNLKLKHRGEPCASFREIAWLWKRQKGLCVVTGRILTRENAQIDHIIPVVVGGSGEIGNLRWVHRDVNYAKRDLSDEMFLSLCREVVAKNGYSE